MAHGEALRTELHGDADPVVHLVRDWRSADLDDQERAMLEFVETLAFNPGQMERDDVERLRDVGFVDEDILEITLITSYYHMINRLSEALGARHEEERLRGEVGSALPWTVRAQSAAH